MKIYRVVADVNEFQYLMLQDESLELSETTTFDGTPKAAKWSSPEVFIYKPNHKKGNFPDFWATSTLVVDETALEQLRDLLEMSGELLPLRYKSSLYHILNVTQCINALDEHKTEWFYEKESGPIKKYVFHANRLAETPLFKIPQTCKSEILTVEGLKDPDDEFKGRIERLGLKGLNFVEVWNDKPYE